MPELRVTLGERLVFVAVSRGELPVVGRLPDVSGRHVELLNPIPQYRRMIRGLPGVSGLASVQVRCADSIEFIGRKACNG